MKVAILGASGIVGRSLCSLLNTFNIDWKGTYFTKPIENSVLVDVTNSEAITEFFEKESFTHCINCVAERNVDICEKNSAKASSVNTLFAQTIAKECAKRNIYFLHISTDYVFDGNNSPYLPESECSPIQMYGKSKHAAEQMIHEIDADACIVRVPVLYTHRYKDLNETAVTSIAKKVMNKSKVQLEDNYCLRSPVFIDDFAVFLFDCLKKEKKGTFHFYNSKDKVTKYQIAEYIGRYLSIDISHIKPQTENKAQAGRPYDTTLRDNRYKRDTYPDTSLEDGIALCLHKFKHPCLNKHEKPVSSIFYLIDLDGTLLDTDKLHYNAYKKAFDTFGIDFCSWEEYISLLSVESYCKEKTLGLYDKIKEEKQRVFYQEETISFLPGAEEFLQWLLMENQNFVIVTNTSKRTIEFFKEKVPLLRTVKNWIAREDVENPKPHSEPYEKAKELFSNGEDSIIGIENSLSGFMSLKDVTPIVYIVGAGNTVSPLVTKEDCYFIRDLTDIFSN